MTSQKIKIPNEPCFDLTHILDKCEIAVETLPDTTRLDDIVRGFGIGKIAASPVKRIKIGNGGSSYTSLKSIIILSNADFIITNEHMDIIDYITNSNPLDIEPVRKE